MTISLFMSASYLPAEGGGGKDPLYAALLGGEIGSALGGAQPDLTRDTLDEAVSVTFVHQNYRFNERVEKGSGCGH
jgi:hypothetical protein